MTNTPFYRGGGIVLLAAIALGALFLNTGSLPLFDEDEGAYAQVTQEMLASGDLLVPRLGGELFFHKPPMIYWTQACSVALLGTSELAFRLPSVLASLAWAALLFAFVRRHLNQQSAWLSAFFLVTAMQISLITRAAIADALLNLFITLAMFALYDYSRTTRKRYIRVAYIGMALGFMTKGPIAVMIPVVVSGIYFISRKELRSWLRVIFHPSGWAIFLVIALPWYLVLIQQHGWHFIQEMFLVHNVGRFRDPMEGHSGTIAYYVPIVLVGLMPFTTLLFRPLSQIRLAMKNPLDRFLWLWFGFVLLFFSIAGTKLHHYIIYGYIPLLILMAHSVETERKTKAVLFALPTIVFLFILFFLKDIAQHALPGIEDQFTRIVVNEALPEFGRGYRITVGITAAGILLAAIIPGLRFFSRIVIIGCLFYLLITGQVIAKVAHILQGPVKEAAIMAREQHLDVVMWKMNYPSFHVYYGKPALKRRAKDGDVIITKADKLDKIASHHILYQKFGIVLTRIIQR